MLKIWLHSLIEDYADQLINRTHLFLGSKEFNVTIYIDSNTVGTNVDTSNIPMLSEGIASMCFQYSLQQHIHLETA